MTLMYFLLAITFLVFVHELGHFLAARSCGVRVLSFSIGFGPALASVQWRGTEYRLAMIPLGGYVKMLGESSEQHADPTESFAAQSPLRRAWISLAGPLANLVLAWLLFAALVWQQPEQVSAKIDTPEPSSWAHSRGLESGDRVMAVGNTTIQTWRDLEMALRVAGNEPLQLHFEKQGMLEFDRKDGTAPLIQAPEGDLLNPRALGLRPMVVDLFIGQVVAQSPAEAAGLQAGDRLLSNATVKPCSLRYVRLRMAKPAGSLRALERAFIHALTRCKCPATGSIWSPRQASRPGMSLSSRFRVCGACSPASSHGVSWVVRSVLQIKRGRVRNAVLAPTSAFSRC
ncbi:MAG: RIP metalloprotease RseP [Betaproteobacteria bacterium]|nr:RIP metalloprotease RseP [Betaproteobacteria bacterium]